MTLKTEIMRGMKWTAGAKLVSQAITWGITIFVMRLLAPGDYGLLAMATVVLAFLSMFSEIGLGPALVQQREVSEQEFKQAFFLVIATNLTMMLLVNLLAPLVAHFYNEPRLLPVLRALSLQFLLTPFAVIPDVQLQRRLDYKYRSLSDLTTGVLISLCTLGLAVAGMGVWSLVGGTLLGALWRTGFLNWVAPFRHWPSPSLKGFKRLLTFSGNVTGSRFLWFIFMQADTMIIGRVLGGEVLGMYSVAMHLATLPVQRVSAILNQVAFPAFSRFQQDHALIRTQLLRAISLISFMAFPILWGMSSVANELVLVVLGKGWEAAVLPLQILTLIMPFRTLVMFLPTITDAIGRPELGLHNVILGCATMPVAFYVGTHWGIAGVALAWLLVYPFVLLLNAQRMLKVFDLTVTAVARQIAPTLLCGAGMYGVVWATAWATRAWRGQALGLAVEVAAGGIAYLLLTWLINRDRLLEMKMLVAKKA